MRLWTAMAALLCLVSASAAPAGETFTVKNDALSRTISSASGLLKTTKLEANGVQMLDGPSVEFMIDIDLKDKPVTLVPGDFDIKELDQVTENRELQTSLRLMCRREDLPLEVYVTYYSDPAAQYLQKSVTIRPCAKAAGAVVRRVVIDYFQFRESLKPVVPATEDLADGKGRFRFEGDSNYAAMDPGAGKGVYFFTSSLFGSDRFSRGGLIMAESTYTPVEKGFETARATIGAVAGPPEVLYRRFREFLWSNYCVMRGRPAPATCEAWLSGPRDATKQKCIEEARAIDEKYSGALRLEVPEGQAAASGVECSLLNTHYSILTGPYADYVDKALVRLVTECGVDVLGMDGADWITPKPPPQGVYDVPDRALPFAIGNRYRAIYHRLRKANPSLVICLSGEAASLPAQAHRLNVVDQIGSSDGGVQDCLGDRRQRWNQAFIYPPYTINPGGPASEMALPFPQVKYAVISGISTHPRLQGARQIAGPSAELSAYLKRFYAFRKRFEPYFETYQHVLGLPDGKSVDGEAYIAGSKGFIVLFNPSDQPQKIAVPLDEPGLELKGDLKLTDWTELDSGAPIGTAKPGDRVEIEIPALSAKIIGVNVE